MTTPSTIYYTAAYVSSNAVGTNVTIAPTYLTTPATGAPFVLQGYWDTTGWEGLNSGTPTTIGGSNLATTPEQRAALEAQLQTERAEYERRRRDWEAARRVIAERAERLLVSCLDSAQRDQLAQQGSFTVRARSGRIYQIRRGRAQNVFELDGHGHALRRYCAHPAEGVPDADTMLSQKLMIECAEEAFLAVANVS